MGYTSNYIITHVNRFETSKVVAEQKSYDFVEMLRFFFNCNSKKRLTNKSFTAMDDRTI